MLDIYTHKLYILLYRFMYLLLLLFNLFCALFLPKDNLLLKLCTIYDISATRDSFLNIYSIYIYIVYPNQRIK